MKSSNKKKTKKKTTAGQESLSKAPDLELLPSHRNMVTGLEWQGKIKQCSPMFAL